MFPEAHLKLGETMPEAWYPVQYEDTSDDDPAEDPYSDSANGKAHTLPEADAISDLDLYINAEVLLPKDGEHM